MQTGEGKGGHYQEYPRHIFLWLGSSITGDKVYYGLKPGVKASIQIEAKVRRGFRLDPGKDFLNPVVQPGEVREMGDVKVKEAAQ